MGQDKEMRELDLGVVMHEFFKQFLGEIEGRVTALEFGREDLEDKQEQIDKIKNGVGQIRRDTQGLNVLRHELAMFKTRLDKLEERTSSDPWPEPSKAINLRLDKQANDIKILTANFLDKTKGSLLQKRLDDMDDLVRLLETRVVALGDRTRVNVGPSTIPGDVNKEVELHSKYTGWDGAGGLTGTSLNDRIRTIEQWRIEANKADGFSGMTAFDLERKFTEKHDRLQKRLDDLGVALRRVWSEFQNEDRSND